MKQAQQLFRPEALAERWGMSASTVRRLMNLGKLPQPVRLSERIYGWTLAQVEKIEVERSKTVKPSK
jgi:predicted DNA-binding transcriptional regulator AlpA